MSIFKAIEDIATMVVPAIVINAIQVGILLDYINFRIGWTFIFRCIMNGFLLAQHFCKRLIPSINRPSIVYPFALIINAIAFICFGMAVLFGLLFEFARHILGDETGDARPAFKAVFVFVTRNYSETYDDDEGLGWMKNKFWSSVNRFWTRFSPTPTDEPNNVSY